MNLSGKIFEDKNEVENSAFWHLVGPFFVLSTIALVPMYPLFIAVGAIGLILNVKYRKRGFLYSLVLLFVAGIAFSTYSDLDFIWIIGIETSFALSFFITAQNSVRQIFFLESIFSQLETKNNSIKILEEEIQKSSESMKEKHLVLQEKNGALQKQLDEILSEQNSITVLNEVLRKKAAQLSTNSERLEESLIEHRLRSEFEKREREEIEAENNRLKNESLILIENKKLIDQINAIRLEKEQIQSINETLARLYSKEKIRAKEAEDQLDLNEKERRENISKEITFLKEALLKKEDDLNQALLEKENLKKELLDLSSTPDQVTYVSLEKRVKELMSIEAKFKQLKHQFEEKNEVLGKTRQELFQLDTAFQTLQREVSLDDRIDREEVVKEFSKLEQTISHLEEENKELQDLVTSLTTR